MKKRNITLLVITLLALFVTVAVSIRWFYEKTLPPRLVLRDKILAVEGSGITNMRDIGGWKTKDGKSIKKGMLYRSSAFNYSYRRWNQPKWTIPDESRKFLVETLGIKTEIDLRKTDGETHGMNASPLGDSVSWLHIPSLGYSRINSESGREAFAEVFKVFLDRSRYPIVFHCCFGKDRAATLAIILEAVLGVSEEDIKYDYRQSWIELRKKRKFTYKRFNELLDMLKTYPGDNINEQAESFIISLGYSKEDLTLFRSIMLDSEIETSAHSETVPNDNMGQ